MTQNNTANTTYRNTLAGKRERLKEFTELFGKPKNSGVEFQFNITIRTILSK
jgi:hypothetical protein